MLIHYENDTVHLFPAWPKEWDVEFKVKAPGNTTIEGLYENGKMVRIKTIPEDKIIVVQGH
jgi:hypothetical protein